MSKPFRDRDPVIIGAAGLATIALLIVVAFRAQDLPIIGGGDTYYASFSESGGLKVNDEVRIAGVRVGKVDSVELDNGEVKVGFKVKTDSVFGVDTGAAIKVESLLGGMYLSLEPDGAGQLQEGSTIPVERTTSPFDLVDAFEGLAETSAEIDTDQLAASLTTFADLTRNTPREFRNALAGLSALSRTIASRDGEINSLLRNLEVVSSVVSARDADLVSLMRDSDLLFRALVGRRQAVHDLLVSTTDLASELTAIVSDSREDLKPALGHLETVIAVIRKNQDNIDNSLRLLAPFYRVIANVVGTGPWFEAYIINLLHPVPSILGSSE